MLLALTVCDIRAVGPGVWNGWKGQLLRTLFWETEVVLGGGHSAIDRKSRVAAAQEALRRSLPGWSDPEFDAYAQRHYPAYWLKVELARQVAHAKLLHAMAVEVRSLATEVATDAYRGVTELTIVAPDHPRLLSIIAGACAGAGGNIVDAQIFTTTDGFALDTIFVSRAFDRDDDELRRAGRIARTIEQALRGEIRVSEIVKAKSGRDARARAFAIPPEVMIDNTLSRPLHGDRGLRARPSRAALRSDLGALQAQSEHRLGAYRDLRRKGRRRLLRHRPDRGENHLAVASGGDQEASAGDFLKKARRRAADAPALDFCAASPDIGRDQIRGFDEMNDTTDAQTLRNRGRRAGGRGPPAEADGFAVIEKLNAENAELKDRVLRALAEMENLRRRTEREVADARLYGVSAFAREMLAVADNLARALDSVPAEARASADGALKSLIEGVELTARDLQSALGAPRRHQAGAAGREVRPEFPPGDVRGSPRGAARRRRRPGHAERLEDRRTRAAARPGRRLQGRGEDRRAEGGVIRLPYERLALSTGRGKGNALDETLLPLAGPGAPRAFPNPCQTFPNFGPFSPNISKESFGRFVGNQQLATSARTLSLCSKFLAPIFVARPAPWAVGKTDRAQGDKKKRSTIFGFQKHVVGAGKRRRFPRRSAAFPSTGSCTTRRLIKLDLPVVPLWGIIEVRPNRCTPSRRRQPTYFAPKN